MNRSKGHMALPIVVFTDHARRRSQARGVRMLSAELATRFGNKTRVGGGRFQRVFTKSCIERAESAGIAVKDIEVAVGVPVIVSENEQGIRTIISVLPKNSKRLART